jgi:Leucine-rich repeat (LRR) protein
MYKKIMLVILLTGSFTGCKNYSVSLNDRTVYTPAGVFKDFQISDVALSECITQTIYDLHITKAEDLTRLNCSEAGIKDLDGLDKFFALKELNLSNNHIHSITALNKLGRLEILFLQNNKIVRIEPLLNLLHLKQINISNNSITDCKNLKQLKTNLQDNKAEFIYGNQCLL